jgi:hypothetical protein
MTNGGEGPQSARARARDAAVRRTRAIVVGVTAGAVALSGVFSVVAAHAFKGRKLHAATPTATATSDAARPSGPRVPGPDAVPPIAGDPAPLQPPEQPPATPVPQPAAPQPEAPAPAPQVSGGS